MDQLEHILDEAEVVGLDDNAGEVLVKMGSITTRAPIAGVAPAGR